MILAFPMVVGAVVAALVMPVLLERLPKSVPPVVALTSWLATIAGFFLFAGSAALVLIWPTHAPVETTLEALTRCLATLQHAVRPWIGAFVGVGSVLLAGAVAVRLVFSAHRHEHARSKIRTLHRDILTVVARRDAMHSGVIWLEHPLPMAYSIDGRPGYIVATEGLARCLTTQQCDAVIAHERAHLRSHHHLILSVCEVLAAAFPRIPLFVAAPAAVETLIELAADQSAAEATSTDSMRSALLAVSASVTHLPTVTLRLLNDATGTRLRRLEMVTSGVPRTGTRAGACIAAALLPTLLPALAAGVALMATATIGCVLLR